MKKPGIKISKKGAHAIGYARTEELSRALLDSAPDALVIVNETGTIILVNSQTEKLFGYTRDELIGQPGNILLPEQYRKTHSIFQKKYIQVPLTRPMGMGMELFGVRKDGKEFPVEISLSSLETKAGLIVTASIRDITERKTIERQVQMLGQTIRSMKECVVITDLNNVILSVNPAMLMTYGYTEEELLGRNIGIVQTENSKIGRTREILDKTMEGGWEGELVHRRKNKEEFPIYLSISVVRDHHGKPVALVSIARDISEQKRIQQQLDNASHQRAEDTRYFTLSIQRAQEEERRRIARELHDGLSQRLSGMKLHLELLSGEVPSGNRKITARIKKIKTQINEMINETHRISVNLHPTTLDDFGLTAALQLLFKEFEATFKIPITYYPSISTHERFDRYIEIALYRITQEALNNIAKHSKATSIVVRFARDTAGFSLSIEDNGVGFDIQKQKMKSGISKGLGLISMKERTENVGGTFKMISETDSGTKIIVQIPARK